MVAVAWAPNNRKLAAYCKEKDRVIYLYDEYGEGRDRFPTRPAEIPGKDESTSYTVAALAFSPDSTKLAVGQTDGIIFIYKVGEDFKMKKAITNKIPQPSPVKFIIWPNELEIICGLFDGKLRHTPVIGSKGARSRTFYNPDSCNIALVSNPRNTEIGSAHVDGRIAVFLLESSDLPLIRYVIQHQCPAYGLAFGNTHLLAAGSDCKISVYEEAEVVQQFDYSREGGDRDFITACGSPSGLAIVIGGYDRIRIFQWAPRKKLWEEGPILEMENFYSITSLAWNKEGTRIAAGTMIGGLHLFESVLRRMKTDSYEVAFATPYHAIVTVLDPPMTANLESRSKLEILDVKVLGNHCYAVALTLETMILCDIEKKLVSEIRWDNTEDEERFYFDNPNVCMVFHNGEMTLIEYGNNKILGSFRTEFLNPHMISVRINERIPVRNADLVANKKLAYLIDHQTATIVDLVYSSNLGYVTHDSNIDWMELNETAVKLLFRDRRLRLVLVDIESMGKHTIIQLCNFVQWVPSSDVIVAQSKRNLCIWYNVDTPDQLVEIETNGLAFDVVREPLQTAVLIQDGNTVNEILLDSSRIEFGTAMLDGDYIRAMLYLEIAEPGGETGTMWKQLSKDAVEARELKIAERASYASGDFSKAKYLADTVEVAEDAYLHGVDELHILNTLRARTSTLAGDLQVTENVFLENEKIDGAVQMYKSIHKWKDAFRVLGEKPSPSRRLLAKQYIKYLERTGQDELIAEFMEEHGNFEIAAAMYLRCGLPIKAARVIQSHISELDLDSRFVSDLGKALTQSGFFIEAAEFYDISGQEKMAYENYKKSKQFEQAVRVAKKAFPNLVVTIEEEWADNLFENRLFDMACNHYVEAGRLRKALEAAIEGKQWSKALHIIEVVDDVKSVAPEYIRIGDFYQLSEKLRHARNCYVKAAEYKRAINMYTSRGLWDEAYDVALNSPEGHEPLGVEFTRRAEQFIQESNYREAERLFCAMGSADNAIAMYNSVEMYDEMFRLVEQYHPSHLTSSYQHLATALSTKNPKAAEMYYLKVGAHDLALSMYVENKMWEDALRVSKAYQGGDGFKKVVFTWAQSLGADLGLKLLKRFNLVDECMEYMCTQHDFQFALEIAPLMSKDKVKEVNILQAKYLEYDQAKYDEAASSYVKGGNPEAAVEMYMKHNMFEQAIEVAEGYCRNKLDDILVRYARVLFQQKHYTKFESVLFKARRPEIAVEIYRDENMWLEAFKVCKDHVPSMLEMLQQQFDLSGKDKIRLRSDVELIDQGIEFERMGETKGAVDCYLKLGDEGIGDVDLLAKYWKRGASLATSFFRDSYGEKAIAIFAEKLGSISCHMDAAGLWSAIGRYVEAVEQLIAGRLWVDAERAAVEMGPDAQQYVRDRYTDSLKESKSVEELTTVNLSAALELLEQEGQWEDLLDRAKVDEHQMFYYLEKYVTLLIEDKNPIKALEMYRKYGVSSWKPNINTFENLIFCYFQEDIDTYESNALLREIAYKFATVVERDPEADEEDVIVMDGFRHMCHLFACRSAYREIPELQELTVRLNVALLRYSDVLPIERCFFDAGVGCKAIGWTNMAFVFLNHYMDVFDAIEAGLRDTSVMDYSELAATDIPKICALPSFHSIEGPEHEQVREWVLSASMDRNISPELRRDFREEYEASLTNRDSDEIFEPCVISGYPAISNPISFMDGAKAANKIDWDRFYQVLKTGACPKLQDIYNFLVRWSKGSMD